MTPSGPVLRCTLKVGDLVQCGDKIAVVGGATRPTSEDQRLWLECYWLSGDFAGAIVADEVELFNESR